MRMIAWMLGGVLGLCGVGTAQQLKITKIDPPNWYAGLPKAMLLVKWGGADGGDIFAFGCWAEGGADGGVGERALGTGLAVGFTGKCGRPWSCGR